MKEKSEFDNFADLTKRLVSVPKAEIDKRHEEWKRKRTKKEKRTPPKKEKQD